MLGRNWRWIDGAVTQGIPEGAWRTQPMTAKQKTTLRARGVDDPTLTRGQAFDLIRAWNHQHGVAIRRTPAT
jgi:hypothetical protein